MGIAAYYHFAKRARERYQVQISYDDYTVLSQSIRNDSAYYVTKWEGKRKLYFVNHCGVTMFVVYSSDGILITALPLSQYHLKINNLQRHYDNLTDWKRVCYSRISEKMQEKADEYLTKGNERQYKAYTHRAKRYSVRADKMAQ